MPDAVVSRHGTHGPAYKTGIAVLLLLALSDLAASAALASDDGPPVAVTLIGIVLGVITLIALPAAYRSGGAPQTVVVVSRIVSALTGIPAFFVSDPPSWAVPVVTVQLVLTVLGVALVVRGERWTVTA